MPELMPYQALYMNMDLFVYIISKNVVILPILRMRKPSHRLNH